jgi:hypothetical protein
MPTWDDASADTRERQERIDALRRLAGVAPDAGGSVGTHPLTPSLTGEGEPGGPRIRKPFGGRTLLLVGLVVCVALAGAIWRLAAHGAPHRTVATATTTATRARSTLPGGGACVRLGDHPSPPYANIQVTRDAAPAHSEPDLAEDPADPLHLVGGSKFFTDLARYRFQIGYVASFDGGCTWTGGHLLPGFDENELVSDPSFAFAPDGTVYVGVLYSPYDPATGNWSGSGIAVLASHDGGRTFDPPVKVLDTPGTAIFHDKPWIAVDQTRGPDRGSLYVMWSYDSGGFCGDGNYCSQALAFSRSTDGGRTFSPTRTIEGSAPFCTNPATGRPAGSLRCDGALGAIPVVEPDGTVVVAFAYENLMDSAQPTRLLVISSTDGGLSWTAPDSVTTLRDDFGVIPPANFRTVTLPALAADPTTGQLYLAWSQRHGREDDVFAATSTDAGTTWSAPLQVNDDAPERGATHVQPQIAVAPDGVVTVIFFDTHYDPRHALVDVTLAQSLDHGASWRPNQRVTTASFDPATGAPTDEYGNRFLGDYQGLAVDNTFAHPFWNDTRAGSQQLFTAAVPSG